MFIGPSTWIALTPELATLKFGASCAKYFPGPGVLVACGHDPLSALTGQGGAVPAWKTRVGSAPSRSVDRLLGECGQDPPSWCVNGPPSSFFWFRRLQETGVHDRDDVGEFLKESPGRPAHLMDLR